MQIEKYIADKITSLCEKRDISKYRLSQLSGISQSSLGRIMAQENLPSLITLEKICTALGVTLSQFFQEGNSENLTEKSSRACLKKAFRELRVPVCGRFYPNEGGVAGYGNRIRVKYTAKWGLQIAEMIFQTRSRDMERSEYK